MPASCCGRNVRFRRRGAPRDGRVQCWAPYLIVGCDVPRSCRHPQSQRRRPPKSRPRASWHLLDQTRSYAIPIRHRQDSNCRQTDGLANLALLPNFCRRPGSRAILPVWFRHIACRGRSRATRFARTDLRTATACFVQFIIAASCGSLAAQSSICPFVSFATSQVAPKSSERHTPAPCHSPPPPAHNNPVTGSPMM